MLFPKKVCYACSKPDGFLTRSEAQKLINDVREKISNIPEVTISHQYCCPKDAIRGFAYIEITYKRKKKRDIISIIQSAGAVYSDNCPTIIGTGIHTYSYSL